MKQPRIAAGVLAPYFLLSYVAVLVNAAGLAGQIQFHGAWTYAFAAAAFPVYCLFYLAPAVLLVLGMRELVGLAPIERGLRRLRISPVAVVWLTLIVTTSALQILLFADKFIFRLYGRHLDGFVWNVAFTPGGMDSLGGGTSTTITFSLIFAGFVAMQALFLVAVLWSPKLRQITLAPIRGRRAILVGVFALLAAGYAQIAYGVSMINGYTPVLRASSAVPGFFPITFTRWAQRHGYKVRREQTLIADVHAIGVRYPIAPLDRHPPAKPLNLVFLVAESLRADMLDAEIMPHTWAFASQSLHATRHYSGGNGTRMAIFSMFYGLYGPYWFNFLQEQRGPVLVDEMIAQNYDIQMYTSAGFSYPEFDRTAFVRIPHERMHLSPVTPIYERDKVQIDALLASLDSRPTDRPFMRYMFFEAPHANYHFPKSAVIRTDYCQDLNYATMDVERDIGPMKNRYINACHYLDTQIARVLDYLHQNGLLDSTIVIVTGDHGEEFMEKGRWGHNSTFSEEQTRPPFAMWVPGATRRRIDTITSHLDVPSTLLPLMGVKNPPADYGLGINLLSDARRELTVVGDWDRLAIVNPAGKIVLPVSTYGFTENLLTDANDKPLPGSAARKSFLAERQSEIVGVMRDLRRFSR